LVANEIHRSLYNNFNIGNDFLLTGSQAGNPVQITLADLNNGTTKTLSQSDGLVHPGSPWQFDGTNYSYSIKLQGSIAHTISDSNNTISISADHEHTDSVTISAPTGTFPDAYIDNEGAYDNRTNVSTHNSDYGGSGTSLAWGIGSTNFSQAIKVDISIDISRQQQHFDRDETLNYSDSFVNVTLGPDGSGRDALAIGVADSRTPSTSTIQINPSDKVTKQTSNDLFPQDSYSSSDFGGGGDFNPELFNVSYFFYPNDPSGVAEDVISYSDSFTSAEDGGHAPLNTTASGFGRGTATQSSFFKWSVRTSFSP